MANLHIFLVAAVLVIIETAEALRCWECNSSEGGRCADYFNQTEALRKVNMFPNYSGVSSNQYDPQTPKSKDCSSPQYYDPSQKTVCMKKVQTIHDRKMYTRQCAFIHRDTATGGCPNEPNSNQLDYCVTCDSSDYCNGATSLQNKIYVFLVVPLAGLLFRKI